MSLSRRKFVCASLVGALGLSQLKSRALASVLAQPGLKDLFKDDFLIGTMLRPETYMRHNPEFRQLITSEFNSIVADNTFKWVNIHPTSEHYDWVYADEFVNFGLTHNMHIQGHVLIWHSQYPPSLFLDEKEEEIGRQQLLEKMEKHISAVVGRYRGRIHSWDVVNEALDENGFVNNHWHRIIGPEYMANAFEFAHAADPQAMLVYNDYGLASAQKRLVLVDQIRKLRALNTPIHAVGLQGHFSLNGPELAEIEKTIIAIANEGLRVQISELEIDVLPDVPQGEFPDYSEALDPYREGLPDEISAKLAARYQEIFALFLKHKDKIDRVTFWGTHDGESWKNDFPIIGRVNHPLLFDRQWRRKQAYDTIANLKQNME